MDEFMVSGETIVRDLQFGLARGSRARRRDAGRLPPRHVRPRRADAAAARGSPASSTRSCGAASRARSSRPRSGGRRPTARACAPSTSTARTRTGATCPTTRRGSCCAPSTTSRSSAPARLGDMLLMNGTDHQMPQPWLGRVVAEANDDPGRLPSSSSRRCAEYLADAADRRARRPSHGELRSGARANLLMGVASNRVDVHQACAAAERALERRAEPLAALFLPADAVPARAARRSRGATSCCNSAHDSSCACSHDEVVDQVLVRYHEARQIGDGLDARRGARARARGRRAAGRDRRREPDRARRGRASSRARCPGDGPVHFVDAGRHARARRRSLGEISGEGYATMVTGQKVRWVLDLMRGTEFAGRTIASYDGRPTGDDVARHRAAGGRAGRRRIATSPSCKAHMLDARRATARRCGCACSSTPLRRVLFDTGAVAGFGWASLHGGRRRRARPARSSRPTPRSPTSTSASRSTPRRDVRDRDERRPARRGPRPARRRRRRRRHVQLLAARRRPCRRRARRGARHDARDRPGARARARSSTDYTWPAYAIGDERSCSRAQRRDRDASRCARRSSCAPASAFLRVTHELDNRCRDHRLRAHFPLPAPVDRLRRRVRVRGRAPRARPPRAARRSSGCRRSRRAGSSTRPTARVGLALCTTGCSSTRSSTTAASSRSRCCARSGYLSRSEPSLRPNPAGPTDRGARRADARRAARRVRGAAPPRRLARRRLLRRGRRVPRPVRTRARRRRRRAPARRRAARCASTAPRSPRCSASPGGLVVRVFRTDARRRAGHDRARRRTRPRLDRRPRGPARRPVRRQRRRSARGRSAPSSSPSALAPIGSGSTPRLQRRSWKASTGSSKPRRGEAARGHERVRGRARGASRVVQRPRRRARCRARRRRRGGPRG